MLSWHYLTRAQYDAAEAAEKSADKLFFITDTKEIYRGTVPFTESVIMYTGDEPASKAIGKIYVNSTTLEGKVWNGTAFTTVIKPVSATVAAGDTNPVSGAAVAAYVTDAIAGVTGSGDLVASLTYDATAKALKVGMADKTTKTVALTGLAVDLVYDAASGELKIKDATGVAVGTGVTLDLERFVTDAEYDTATKTIILYFDGKTGAASTDKISIPVGDLVDTYTAANSKTISMTVTGNQFTAEAIVATTAGNMLRATDTGLFVAATDISGKVDKVASATAGNVATLTAAGGLSDSGKKVGGATLAATPNASTLATEAAVSAIRTALQTSINSKMAKVDTGHADEVLIATADGNGALSGKKVGGATLAATPNASTLATEAAVKAHVTATAVAKTDVVTQASLSATSAAASDAKPISEKAVVGLLEWKEGV